jgi:hypothetical protein
MINHVIINHHLEDVGREEFHNILQDIDTIVNQHGWAGFDVMGQFKHCIVHFTCDDYQCAIHRRRVSISMVKSPRANYNGIRIIIRGDYSHKGMLLVFDDWPRKYVARVKERLAEHFDGIFGKLND